MSVLTRPDLRFDIAWGTNPLVELTDPTLAWVDESAQVEPQFQISMQRRRNNELDEPSTGTLSLTLANDGRYTQLNPASPYYPYVKVNRLCRLRSIVGASANIAPRQAATGSGDRATAAGMSAPSGTVTSVLSTATASAVGTTATFKTLDADATDVEIGDVFRLYTAGGQLKESTFFQITGEASAGGTTTLTFSPAAALSTATTDVLRSYRYSWATGLQPVAGSRLATGDAGTLLAGPDAVAVTAGLSYTWSLYASRSGSAQSASLRILWYDLTGAQLSETTGATTSLTTNLQRLTVTATAPAGAVLARGALANETTLPGTPAIAFRDFSIAVHSGSTGYAFVVTGYAFVPSTVKAGDGMLLWVNMADSTLTCATPPGWTVVGNRISGGVRTYLFKAVATSAGAYTSAGTFPPLTTSGRTNADYLLQAYSGTDPTDAVHQFASVAESTIQASHTTPNLTTTVANCWIISAAFDRSSTTSVWTKPAADTDRGSAYLTGSGAPTGDVSDTAAPVAAGTYGTKIFTSNVAAGDATMWTVALKPSTGSGGTSGTLTVTGGQLEQAGAASAWAAPGITTIHFVGHAAGFPTMWEGGFRALVTINASDRQKLLDAAKIKAAITEQILSTGPVAYYPLTDDSGATGAGGAADTTQPALGIGTAGTVTDDMLQFGGGTGPDGAAVLKLAPTSSTVGKALRGTLTTPLGGAAVTGMSIAACFRTAVTDNAIRVVTGADDGKPTDGGAIGIFDLAVNPVAPVLRAHIKFGGAVDVTLDYAVNYANDRWHMAVATTSLSGGVITTRLYIDGALVASSAPGGVTATEFPEFARWNVGCGATDNIRYLWDGTAAHAAGWNRVLTAGEVADLYTAASSSFAGELSGARAARIAAWAGVTMTDFDPGQQLLEGHRVDEVSLNDNFKLIARSEGGVYFISGSGYATLHDRAHRVNAVSSWTVSAADVSASLAWLHDDQLIANDVTVARTRSDARVIDTASQVIDGYGVRDPGPIDTIVDSDASALARAQAYLARYSQPISRPDTVPIELLGRPELHAALLGAEVSDKFTINQLPAEAPASSVDLYVEGVGMDITPDSWLVTFDASPASFDFGLVLDDPARGLLDTNYVGW